MGNNNQCNSSTRTVKGDCRRSSSVVRAPAVATEYSQELREAHFTCSQRQKLSSQNTKFRTICHAIPFPHILEQPVTKHNNPIRYS
jgi:hypothetical protein